MTPKVDNGLCPWCLEEGKETPAVRYGGPLTIQIARCEYHWQFCETCRTKKRYEYSSGRFRSQCSDCRNASESKRRAAIRQRVGYVPRTTSKPKSMTCTRCHTNDREQVSEGAWSFHCAKCKDELRELSNEKRREKRRAENLAKGQSPRIGRPPAEKNAEKDKPSAGLCPACNLRDREVYNGVVHGYCKRCKNVAKWARSAGPNAMLITENEVRYTDKDGKPHYFIYTVHNRHIARLMMHKGFKVKDKRPK